MANIRPLSPELAEVARTELGENPDEVPIAIGELRAWIEQQPHLQARTDDQFLVGFLRFCKYNQKTARERIEFFYSYKTTTADLIVNPHIDDKIYEICRSGIFAILPNPIGSGGPRIHFTRMEKIDTSKFTVKDIFRYHVFRSEIEINTDDNWIIGGVVEIIDFSKIPFSLLRQFEPRLFRKMAAFLEYGAPTNLIATHIVNASREAQCILYLVRAVMKQKELLHIHSSLEYLQKAIGKQYLPEEYGGENGSFESAANNFERLLTEFEPYFTENDRYGVNEKLRTPENTDTKLSFNNEGSVSNYN